MTIVPLFPPRAGDEATPDDGPGAARGPQVGPPPRRSAGSAEVRVRLVRPERRGKPPGLTPAEVIAQSLDRRPALDRFWAVWMAHQAGLRQRSLRLSGGNQADAEDALSAAMVRAAQAFDRQPIHNPGAWLVRILHNTCMDQHRHNASRVPIESEEEGLPQPSGGAWAGPEPSPEDALSRQESDAAWGRAMSALPEALVEPLRLHLDDWSDERIAAHLDISRELVRKRRQLAKNRLRLLLDL